LKLGTYALLRFCIPLFPDATFFFSPFVFSLALVSVFYSSLTALRQIDLKKVIAYSSIAHMNFSLFGLFSNSLLGVEGALIVMLSHGLISSSLFFCVGMLYDRYMTRLLIYYSGLVYVMPLFASFFFFLFK
jgi:NADH:ubiquinone oxidoreductase subunit 4 (subunit M)